MQILYSVLKNRSESLSDGNCITGLFKYINPVFPPHKKMKVAIILQIHLVGVCMAEQRNKVTRIFASTGSIYIISTHWRSGLLLCCFHQLLEHSVKFTPLIIVDVVVHVHCHLGIYTSADMTSNCP